MVLPEGVVSRVVSMDSNRYGKGGKLAGAGRTRNGGAAILALLVIPVIVSLLLIPAADAADVETALGEIVHLSGYSYESPVVYLFLTGPNLPANGVALDDLSSLAELGGFTRVNVDDKHHWTYEWNTQMSGGSIDEGSYTVWISTEPADRSHLRSGQYRTLSVLLYSPSISISNTAAPQAGAVLFRSVPEGASVTFNGEYRGITPLTIDPVATGTYEARLTLDNHHPVSTQVTVESGALTEVNVTLFPLIGSLSVASAPEGARILLDGTQAGTSPLTLSAVPAGNHTVTAKMPGYADAETTVVVPAGGTTDITLTLAGSGAAGTAPTRSGIAAPSALMPALVAAVLFAARSFRRRRI